MQSIATGNNARTRPQRLLVTILGDYWRGRQEPIPSATLVAVLGEFGVSSAGARAALSRLTSRQLLTRSRLGRRTYYHLTDRALRQIDSGATRILSFGAAVPEWDGRWSVVAFSVSESDRRLRHLMRNSLRFMGFAPLYDALWISPSADLHSVADLFCDLGVKRFTLLRAEILPIAMPNLEVVWDLDSVRDSYQAFIERFKPICERLARGRVQPAEALVHRTFVMDAWRAFPRQDPDLPHPFLPPDWPRARSRQIFLDVYDGLGPLARTRVNELLAASE
ncbi:MAG TPA: PaaX family transcriptional regulator C-terminal domain-containing protein [Candidatus Dormibacteraeota bacterium]